MDSLRYPKPRPNLMKDVLFVDTLEGVTRIVDWADKRSDWMGDLEPPLYIHAEGECLGKDGNISLLTMLVYPNEFYPRVHIIDLHTLGSAAFHAVGQSGKSLKMILESPEVKKAFFDVRNDAHALYTRYDIHLDGVRDVQLMESSTRPTTDARRLLSGLSECVASILADETQRDEWNSCKDKGERLWSPDQGGSYSVFNERPVSDEIIACCVGNVRYVPELFQKYRKLRGGRVWRNLIAEASQGRVAASQKVRYQPGDAEWALSPWSSEQNGVLDSIAEEIVKHEEAMALAYEPADVLTCDNMPDEFPESDSSDHVFDSFKRTARMLESWPESARVEYLKQVGVVPKVSSSEPLGEGESGSQSTTDVV